MDEDLDNIAYKVVKRTQYSGLHYTPYRELVSKFPTDKEFYRDYATAVTVESQLNDALETLNIESVTYELKEVVLW